MKINFSHVFGCQEKFWLQLTKITAIVEAHEEKEALETGWLRDDGVWYQSRSTRLCVRDFKPVRSWPKGYEFRAGRLEDFDGAALDRVYRAYIAHRDYEDYCNPLEYELQHASFGVVFKDCCTPVAFTKFRTYNGGIESAQFCWDYSDPKISLGIAIQAKEIEYAAALGYDFLYLGPGYEKGCTYKSRYPGFEWWTGTHWSRDSERYTEICNRDSSIKTVNELKEMSRLCYSE